MIGPSLQKRNIFLKIISAGTRILIVLIFIIALFFSLKFLYKKINAIFVSKQISEKISSFEVEKFKEIAPRLRIKLSD